MILQAAEDLGLDLTRSWSIGDREIDVQASRKAGVGTIVLLDQAAKGCTRTGNIWRTSRLPEILNLLTSPERSREPD